jgi:hypothetical protein
MVMMLKGRPVSSVVVASVVLAVAIVLGALFYYYLPESPPNVMDDIDYHERKNYTVDQSATAMRFSVDMDQGQLDMSFADVDQYAFTIEISMTATASTPDPNEILQWSVTQGQDGQNATVDFNLNIDQTITTSDLKVKCLLTIDPSYLIGLDVMNSAGETFMRGNSSLMLDRVDFESQAGRINVDLMEGTSLGSDLRMQSQVGSLELKWDNVDLGSGSHEIGLSTMTGSVSMLVIQDVSFAGVVNWTASTNLGNVQTSFYTSGGISSNITGEVRTGLLNSTSLVGYDVNETGKRVEASSQNYPTDHRFEVRLSVNVGSLILIANWVMTK